MSVLELKDIPDYPALEQLAESLWGFGDTRGAAIMVGAGFSRNANLPSPDSKQPPLWYDFSEVMSNKLGYEVGTLDALKLAEEYKAVYGEPALEGLIRDLVTDEQWSPGELHKLLLDLPWSDVLTTNWDTLLEKSSSQSLNRRYEVVRQVADIARTRPPRIVKLHGSLPSSPFVFTEEDYRTYPTKYSPFVNLVQQVILENDLCLIGFSGDDPNFIEWSGWVRDELGASSRRIFLIGILKLTPAKRLYYKARHIIPIDLSVLTEGVDIDDPHGYSTRKVIEYFKAMSQTLVTWPEDGLFRELAGFNDSNTAEYREKKRTDTEFVAQRIISRISGVRKLKESYLGWLVCPSQFSDKIIRCIKDSYQAFSYVSQQLPDSKKAEVLIDLAWANDTAGLCLSQPILDLMNEVVFAELGGNMVLKDRSLVAGVLLRNARENHDNEAFQRLSDWLISNPYADSKALLAYETALQCLESLDLAGVSESLGDIQGQDPVWSYRKAFLHVELGEVEEATKLIRSAVFDLQSRRLKNPNSVWVLSRLAWGGYLAGGLISQVVSSDLKEGAGLNFESKDWGHALENVKADPLELLRIIDVKIDNALTKKQEAMFPVRPRFDAGYYRDASRTIVFGDTESDDTYGFMRLMHVVGVPIRLGGVDFSRGRIEKLLKLKKSASLEVDDYLYSAWLLSYTGEDFIDKVMSRLDVAAMEQQVVDAYVEKLDQVISFARERLSVPSVKHHWLRRLENYHEILSRLVGRVSESTAEKIFQDSKDYFCTSTNLGWGVLGGLENLMKRSLEALAPLSRAKFAVDVLHLPLVCERGEERSQHDWPDLVSSISWDLVVRDSENESLWSSRIRQLIDAVFQNEKSSRFSAISQLLAVYQAGLLTESEQSSFSDALWRQRDGDSSFPKNTQLYVHAFLSLPEPHEGVAEILVRERLFTQFQPVDNRGLSVDLLISLVGVGQEGKCLPSMEQAQLLLDYLLDYESPSSERDYEFMLSREREKLNLFGPAIAQTILPVFEVSSWTKENTEKIKTWINRDSNNSSLEVLPQLVRLDDSLYDFSEEKIRRGLASRDKDCLNAAHSAIRRWVELERAEILQFPERFIRIIIGMISNRRRPFLFRSIYTAELLFLANKFSKDDMDLLAEALEDIELETAYEDPIITPDEAHVFPFIRVSCVSLSMTIINAGKNLPQAQKWLDIAATDPLPEVRHALHSTVFRSNQ